MFSILTVTQTCRPSLPRCLLFIIAVMDVCRQDIVQDICRQVLLMYGDLVAWVFRFQSGLFVPALDFLKVSAENLDT